MKGPIFRTAPIASLSSLSKVKKNRKRKRKKEREHRTTISRIRANNKKTHGIIIGKVGGTPLVIPSLISDPDRRPRGRRKAGERHPAATLTRQSRGRYTWPLRAKFDSYALHGSYVVAESGGGGVSRPAVYAICLVHG